MGDDEFLDPPPTPPEDPKPELAGLDGFVQRHPYLSGFLGFLMAVFAGGIISGVIGGIAATSPTAVDAANGIGGLVTLALFVAIPIWGYRRGERKFLVGFFAMIGVSVVLVGACVAIVITMYNNQL